MKKIEVDASWQMTAFVILSLLLFSFISIGAIIGLIFNSQWIYRLEPYPPNFWTLLNLILGLAFIFARLAKTIRVIGVLLVVSSISKSVLFWTKTPTPEIQLVMFCFGIMLCVSLVAFFLSWLRKRVRVG